MGLFHAADGAQISASIRLIRPYGAGGMGSVWLAEHLTLGTHVVVKFMSTTLAADPKSRERFSREAVAASQVKSPHVVQTFDHGVTPDGVPYIVMELLEGEDLAHRLQRGPLSLRETAAVVTQVCRALSRAHERGVVHRDIKPDNIFLCELGGDEPFVKILDFGIAKAAQNPALASSTQTGAMLGTPYYMSPEQFAGARTIDHRTDLWSLGIVVYECLTGERPFDAETIGALAIAVYSTPIPCIVTLRPDLPPTLDAWLARACARDADGRFATARELADALRAIAGHEARTSFVPDRDAVAGGVAHAAPMRSTLLVTTAGASTVTTTTPTTPPHRRSRRAVATLASLGLAFAIAGLVAATTLGGTPAGPRAAAHEAREESTASAVSASRASAPSASESASAVLDIALGAPAVASAPIATVAAVISSAGLTRDRAKPTPAAASPSPRSTASAPTPPPRPPPTTTKSADCSPNFTLDARGEKRWKPECFLNP